MPALAHPLPGYPTPAGGTFGASRAAFGLGPHLGHDWAAPAGTVVRAAARGVVSRSMSSLAAAARASGAGNHIHITHSDRLETRYVHLLNRLVFDGQVVEAGQPIGTVGSSGIATGNHLHFEVLVDGAHVDPLPYVGGAALPPPTARTVVDESAGHIEPYGGGCRPGYVPARTENDFTSLGPRIAEIGQPGQERPSTGIWTLCILEGRYSVGDSTFDPVGGLTYEFGEWFTTDGIPLLINLAVFAAGMTLVYRGTSTALRSS